MGHLICGGKGAWGSRGPLEGLLGGLGADHNIRGLAARELGLVAGAASEGSHDGRCLGWLKGGGLGGRVDQNCVKSSLVRGHEVSRGGLVDDELVGLADGSDTVLGVGGTEGLLVGSLAVKGTSRENGRGRWWHCCYDWCFF